MWFDDMDLGGRGIVQPAKGPLGRALRQVRLDLYLSQESVARIIGTTQRTISRLELGQPNWPLFVRAVEALGARPVITLEATLSPRDIRERLAAGLDIPFDPDAVDDDWW
ncbi:MAG: helix-turn-helix transcriptional regulator [Frankiales bacterium]|nr:helix-turn-helix transcriptional regulator [Frankiales bacterium]